MTAFYGPQMTKLTTFPINYPHAADVKGKVRCFTEIITMASQTTSDTIAVARLPKGARFLCGLLNASATLGSTTVAVGTAGSTGKYRAAATFTAAAPTLFGVAAAVGVALTADEDIILTLAAATMPSSGTLIVQMFYAVD